MGQGFPRMCFVALVFIQNVLPVTGFGGHARGWVEEEFLLCSIVQVAYQMNIHVQESVKAAVLQNEDRASHLRWTKHNLSEQKRC